MVYFYGYLAIGVITLSLALIENRYSEDPLPFWGERTEPREKFFERIIIPGIAGVLIVLGWPVVLYIWLREMLERRNAKTKPEKDDFLDAVRAFHASMGADGYDSDELPKGTGEFGHDSSNPIPTKGIVGSFAYLGQLRWDDGTKVRYQRIGSGGSTATEHPVDFYKIYHTDEERSATLTISPYQKRNSAKAPKGFTLADSI